MPSSRGSQVWSSLPPHTFSMVLCTQDEVISVWDTLRCWGQNAFPHLDLFYLLEHQLARTVKQGQLLTVSRAVRDYHPRWPCQDLSGVTGLLGSSSWAGICQEGPSDVIGMTNLTSLNPIPFSLCLWRRAGSPCFILTYSILLQLRKFSVARWLLSESSWHIL